MNLKENLTNLPIFVCYFDKNRNASLFTSGMGPASAVPRRSGHGVVAGHFALRHGVRRHSVRTGRPDRRGFDQIPRTAPDFAQLPALDSSAAPVPSGGSAIAGTDPPPSLVPSGSGGDACGSCEHFEHGHDDGTDEFQRGFQSHQHRLQFHHDDSGSFATTGFVHPGRIVALVFRIDGLVIFVVTQFHGRSGFAGLRVRHGSRHLPRGTGSFTSAHDRN